MNVLGILPGLNALAYSAVAFEARGPVPLDADVLHARPLSVETAGNLQKRSRVHHLVLGVVGERYPPSMVVIGPPLDPKEPAEHVDAVAVMLHALASQLRVEIRSIGSIADVVRTLGVDESRLGRCVHRSLAAPLGVRDRRIVVATAVTLAAARQAAASVA